ncbi:MAG: hypothetical protein EZS28_042433 [Streblomastix strix]|uniref:Uncharacterized protein n=1 Tax=Streblomastix strix TaxID=222440 RepID=A0A5J4TWP3_9EUKA|nr:MAG: hypothetical protein EZS28_042433 [Streblomastix strix]
MAPLTIYVSASYGVGITCRQSMIKSKPQFNMGKNQVGYQGMEIQQAKLTIQCCPLQVNLTPLMHYLCDGIVRVLFDDNPDPQVLSMEVIGEIGGSMVRSG